MPFQYFKIDQYKPRAGEVFLFDANIWLCYHDQVNLRYSQKPYVRFLNSLLQSTTDPEVLLPACVLSEVLNRLLRGKFCDQFLQSAVGKAALVKNPVNEKDVFKQLYRKDLRYKRDRDSICQSIYSYSSSVIPIDDQFDQVTLDELTTAFTELEFNDWTIYELARVNNATIVTDDGDFQVENFPIITNNASLLKLK